MTVEEMIHVVDICSSNFRSLTSEEGKWIIDALKAGQEMRMAIYLDDLNAASTVRLGLSVLQWDAAIENGAVSEL